ncbi:MAG: hypothetical protein KGI68_11360 [Alphaproteobacteria bacterium]|jgi:hypothetical protein|nr:hypothetical protein [Alphaproteobacteria bacterium]MDE1985748.1 hypothetical protein [Alphaproteobacteria bacterium]MDE2163403.1 hypothetical protein [Alphaproteobacteria bacterium]MDE2267025.1 hypothetical protein [Alphaproteobacteria bacterium]
MSKHVNSIWFLIGLQVLIYGVLITGTGIWEILHPPSHMADLGWTHPAIWWGGVLLALGLFYVIRFRPAKSFRD